MRNARSPRCAPENRDRLARCCPGSTSIQKRISTHGTTATTIRPTTGARHLPRERGFAGGPSAALLILLLCPLAAFGGPSRSAAIVFGIGSVLLALVIRPTIASHGASRVLDRILLAAAAAIALQSTPLPLPV